MPSVSVVSPDAEIRADAVIVAIRPGADGPVLANGGQRVNDLLGGRLDAALRAAGATGKADDVIKIPTLGLADFPLVVATGLGEHIAEAEAARRAVGAALRAVNGKRRVHVAIDAPVGALTEGALLGSYRFQTYRSSTPSTLTRTITVAAAGSARGDVRRATQVAQAVNLTRDLVNAPPNDLYPSAFADRVSALAREAGLDVEVLDERALKRGRYGGIVGVGQGSSRPPRLVRISYQPRGARTSVALVGKGVTFDSGGLNLKTANLTWMKSDMGGAAAVVAATLALAANKVKVAVTATVPMAENMPSATSYRPSDILTLRNGRTVEVTDTDAEGRLILADALTRAVEDDPDRLIEISTLTGAQLTALGPRLIGAMGEPQWRDEVVAAAEEAGEAVWAMPLPSDLRPGLDSAVADLQNAPAERFGSMLIAGHFLAEFIPDGLAWVHLDIAGPAFNSSGPRDYTPRGGTGAGVRTIVNAVRRLAAP